jgi:hypothetical protein
MPYDRIFVNGNGNYAEHATADTARPGVIQTDDGNDVTSVGNAATSTPRDTYTADDFQATSNLITSVTLLSENAIIPGAAGSINSRAFIRGTGPTDREAGSAWTAAGGGFPYPYFDFTTDASSNAWTRAEVNATEIGFRTNKSSTNHDWRYDNVYARVNYIDNGNTIMHHVSGFMGAAISMDMIPKIVEFFHSIRPRTHYNPEEYATILRAIKRPQIAYAF